MTRLLPLVERRFGLVDLPLPPRRSGRSLPTGVGSFDGDDVDVDVVLLPDVFSAVFDPTELVAACALLEETGHSIAVAELLPTAKFEHVKGMRTRLGRAVARQRALIDRIEATGAIAVSVEPAVGLLHTDDYPKIDPGYPGLAVRPIVDLLAERTGHLSAPGPDETVTVHLFGHCTERALRPKSIDRWASILRSVGHEVVVVDTGCCGMAGVFGHEAEHAEMSSTLFDRLWRPHLERAEADPGHRAVATGWSCRSQAARHGFEVTSPLQLLHRPETSEPVSS